MMNIGRDECHIGVSANSERDSFSQIQWVEGWVVWGVLCSVLGILVMELVLARSNFPLRIVSHITVKKKKHISYNVVIL